MYTEENDSVLIALGLIEIDLENICFIKTVIESIQLFSINFQFKLNFVDTISFFPCISVDL